MNRSSQWEVFRRCLFIVTQLEHGPITRQELLDLAYSDISPDAAQKRLENDLNRLRHSLDIDIVYDSDDRVYKLHAAGEQALLDLPDRAMEGLAFLADTFKHDMPQFQNIQILLDSILALLSSERRADLARFRSSLAVDLRQRDQDHIDEDIWHKLEIAHLHRRMVQFLYTAPRHADQEPRQHLVEARKLYFDTDRRHYYLWGYCRSVNGPYGEWSARCFIRYRIGRIVPGSVEVLPERFPAALPPVPMYPVIYRLSPTIARLGISEHFTNAQIEYNEDSFVTIHAETDDIFHAVRTLLYYGENCQVLGGAELLTEYRRIVAKMGRLHETDPGSPMGVGE